MIRNKFAKLAKETESTISSFKINQKICAIMAAVITLASIGVASNRFDATSNSVLAMSENNASTNVAVVPTSATSNDSDEAEYNKNGFCKVTVIKHGGEPQVVLVRKGTVKKALVACRTTLGSNDEMNCKLSDTVYDGMTIEINEVKYKNKTKTEKISLKKFKKKYPDESTSKLSKNSKVLVNKTVKVKYVNGEKEKETVKSISYKSVETGKSYSELKTVSKLTPEKDFKLDKNGVPVNYKKKITGTASAYCCGTTTATGKSVKPGYIAVNPKQIPYGTKLYIRTSDGNIIYGYASAEDTGGFVSWGNTVADLYMSSYSDCVNFGRRSVEIYVLD